LAHFLGRAEPDTAFDLCVRFITETLERVEAAIQDLSPNRGENDPAIFYNVGRFF
jgi:hypothetical protein